MRKLSTKRLSFQLTIVILTGFVVLLSYSIISNYRKHISDAQSGEYKKLQTISKMLGGIVDGDSIQYLLNSYSSKDAIKNSKTDSVYYHIHKFMRKAQLDNAIESDIYTLALQNDKFYFGVVSGENPYYRHEYVTYPKEIKDLYEKGGAISPYKDENGTWLSYITPILNKNGEVVSVMQVDTKFNSFIFEARKAMIENSLISFAFFAVVAGFLLFTVRRLSKLDAEKNNMLSEAFAELKVKNKDITDSINYAKRIQTALIPNLEDIAPHLPEHFVLFKPKDVVSGDFPWFYTKDNLIYFAAVDCTGHGVPGAMMSMIGCLLLNDIVNRDENLTPSEIVTNLHNSVVNTLRQDSKNRGLADGMDIAICRIDLGKQEIQFSGAHRPLYHISNGQLNEIKGSPFPVGGSQYKGKNNYKNHSINYQEGDFICFCSDGLQDQFGGEDGNGKFSSKRLRAILENETNFGQLSETIENDFNQWKGNHAQIDDVLVVGVRF